MTSPDLRILLVDDVAVIREMLAMSFAARAGFVVVGEAADGEAAISRAAELQPDVVLLDVGMPVMDGLAALPHILRAAPRTRIVMSSGFDRHIEAALRSGAHGYVLKGARVADIAEEIRRVCVSAD